MTITRVQIERVRRFIAENWGATVRTPAQQSTAEVPLPHPFTVPTAGPQFHIFFYWDTYFTCEGLLRQGRLDLVQQDADNMIHLIETLGYIPNFTLKEHLNRSQPPLFSALARALYEHTRDKAWLARAYAALVKEYAFWQAMRSTPAGLNHYAHHAAPEMVAAFDSELRSRLKGLPDDPAERLACASHHLAEAESGWDFNPRFDRRCLDHLPIDLNAALYQVELNAAYFAAVLNLTDATLWQRRAENRQTLIDRYCWDEGKGFYYDYDLANQRCSTVESAAAYWALWCGAASPAQAQRMVENMPLLEAPFGLLSCRPGQRPHGQVYQWDAPNAWPPMQFTAIQGLRRYGYEAEAKRLAQKYIACVVNGFEQTGNLWEKYNALTGGLDVGDEYRMPAMLGWTAGTFLLSCEVVGA
jgi:alpha,alpha-trehalase